MSAARRPASHVGRAAASGAGIAPAGPNLARRPFVNRRPVSRITLLLVVAGVLLLLADLWLYVGYARARQANATQLNALEASIESRRDALQAAERDLLQADLEQQNEVVAFMNRRIAERTFGWSVLFDRLADLLPPEVRLINLSPTFVEEDRRAREGSEDSPRRVTLALQGHARDGEAILELVDALFADPAFETPDLAQESRQGAEVQFSLSVTYLPEVAAALATEEVVMDAPAEAADRDVEGDRGPGGEA